MTINQQDYLEQRHEDIAELLQKSFSAALIYKELELVRFGISPNSLDNYLARLPDKKKYSERVRKHRHSIKRLNL